MIQTPLPRHPATDGGQRQGWHTLVRGQEEDHPALLWDQDEDTLGAYDNGGRGFIPTVFKFSSLADGWHRFTVVGNEGTTSYYIDGVEVGSLTFTATADIFSVGNCAVPVEDDPQWQDEARHCLAQQWGDLAGFMIFDTALTSGQVAALYAPLHNVDLVRTSFCSLPSAPIYRSTAAICVCPFA